MSLRCSSSARLGRVSAVSVDESVQRSNHLQRRRVIPGCEVTWLEVSDTTQIQCQASHPPRKTGCSHHLHSCLRLPRAVSGLLGWKELDVSWLGSQLLQVAQSILLASCLCSLGVLCLWKGQLPI